VKDLKKRIVVEIYGTQYKFKAGPETTEEYLQEVAAYVDGHMRAIGKEFPGMDITRVAVLAAVNMADEYFKQKKQLADTARRQAESEQKADELERLRAEYIELQKKYQQQSELQKSEQLQLAEQLQALREENEQLRRLQEEYQNLREEYAKLKNEYNEWIELVEKNEL
jgi:cell division protein ZapA (FtsZ GTPase activity inhibitor)